MQRATFNACLTPICIADNDDEGIKYAYITEQIVKIVIETFEANSEIAVIYFHLVVSFSVSIERN